MKIRTSPVASALRIAICTAGIICLIPDKVLLKMFSDVELSDLSQAAISTAYVLDDQSWTAFSLPPGTELVKVVSNAVARGEIYRVEGPDEQYSIRYEVTDSEGNVLRQHVYWQKSQQREYIDPATQQTVAAKFFVGGSGVPLGTRSFLVSLRGLTQESLRLRLQLGLRSRFVTEALARLYVADNPPPYKLRYLWERMSPDKQEGMAKGNLYPIDMITEAERRNLVRNRWVAVAPIGVADRDYRLRKLYSMRDEALEEHRREKIFPVGVYMSPEVVGVLPLPEDGGEVRLEFQEVDDTREQSPSILHFVQYGTEGGAVESSAARLDSGGAVYKQVVGGVLEVRPPRELVMRAFLESDPTSPEITPIPMYVPAYMMAPGRSIDLKVVKYWDSYTPYRVDVRQVFPENAAPREIKPAVVYYQFLDAAGAALSSGFMVHEKPLSRYDVLVGTGTFEGYRITEPSRFHVAVPEGCRTFRLLTPRRDLVVSAFTRPRDIARTVRVPEDAYAFHRRYDEEFQRSEDAPRTWFLVRPTGGAEWAKSGFETLLRLQSRPPARSAEAGALEREYEVLHPQQPPTAWQIIAATDASELDILPGTRHRYVKMANGHEVSRSFHGEPGSALVAPHLVCLKDDHSLASLRVFLDGELHFQGTLASQASEIDIPPFEIGRHRISVVSSQSAEMFMSGISESRDRMHLKRTVYPLHEGPLEYLIHKERSERELLPVRIYVPASYRGRAVVRVRTDIPPALRSVVSEDWTVREHRYEVRPRDDEIVQVLASDADTLRAGYRFSVALGSDLVAGSYRISIALEDGPPTFVHVAKQVAKKSRRSVFTEREGRREE